MRSQQPSARRGDQNGGTPPLRLVFLALLVVLGWWWAVVREPEPAEEVASGSGTAMQEEEPLASTRLRAPDRPAEMEDARTPARPEDQRPRRPGARGPRLRGRVVDDEGEPVAGCEVRAALAGLAGLGTAGKTAPVRDGAFVIEGLAPGSWTVRAVCGAQETALHMVTLGTEDVFLELRFVRSARLTGRVLDIDDHPLPGARVQVSSLAATGPSFGSGRQTSVVTDARGEFVFADLPPGPQSVLAAADGRAPSESVSVRVDPGGAEEGLVLRLRRAGSLTGEALDAAGEPIANAQVVLTSPALPGVTAKDTDASGGFAFEGLPAGRYFLTAVRRDSIVLNTLLARKTVDLPPGEALHVVLVPEPERILVHGLVRCAGQPLPDAKVRIIGTEGVPALAATDAAGRFELGLARSGPVTVSVTLSSGSTTDFKRTLRDAEEATLVLDLAGGVLVADVRDSEGAAVDRASISLAPAGEAAGEEPGRSKASARTDAEGRARIEGLAPGSYFLRVGEFRAGPNPFAPREETIEIGPDATVTARIVLEPGARISGTVRDLAGTPVPGAEVVVVCGRFARPAKTRVDGSFRLDQLPSGTVRVTARAGERSAPWEQLRLDPADDVEIVLTLGPATRVAVEVVERDGTSSEAMVSVLDPEGHFLAWRHRIGTGSGAWPAYQGVWPAGEYELCVESADEPPSFPAERRPLRLVGQAEEHVTVVVGGR